MRRVSRWVLALGFCTLLILLSRLKHASRGFGALVSLINSINPFYWWRRRQWSKLYNADPAFCLEEPMESAAGILYVMAKCSGDFTSDQKKFVLDIFQADFHLAERDAVELLASSAFLGQDRPCQR